jgi:hypothetical protein
MHIGLKRNAGQSQFYGSLYLSHSNDKTVYEKKKKKPEKAGIRWYTIKLHFP